MFSRLFTDSGLSLDRLRALVGVGAAGSIVRASGGDSVKQSQYSRQIKELEDFFQIHLIERHGKGIRLTSSGKELARISRFFLLGLSNFQRGCLTEEQPFRIGASATNIDRVLLPALTDSRMTGAGIRYAVETAADDEIESRLHDLTLDFGVVTAESISRPLQLKELGSWRLKLWVPKGLFKSERQASAAFKERRLPLAVPAREFALFDHAEFKDYEARLTCNSFLEARTALENQGLAAFLPDFLEPGGAAKAFLHVRIPAVDSCVFRNRLAWNPRLLRLNPHASRRRDSLLESLATRMRLQDPVSPAAGPSPASGSRCRRSSQG
jgi:DNA-binding transcriptional LysR family regulator